MLTQLLGVAILQFPNFFFNVLMLSVDGEFYFSPSNLYCTGRLSNTSLNESRESMYLCLGADLRGKAFNILSLNMILLVGIL